MSDARVGSPEDDAAPELDLDDEQRKAVEASERAIAVLAGPGSGKTRVLSYRTRHLLQNDPGSNALLLTFTNKAAAEMKARALDVAVVSSDRIWASTFHTFGMRILRSHGVLVGINPEFEIADSDDQKDLVVQATARAGTKDWATRWGYLRVRRQPVEEEAVARWGAAYEELKRSDDLLDFDDLLVFTADLFEQHRAVAQAYGSQYTHLLVDEFQDTNAAQFATVRALCEFATSISLFADDDQAIYQFAGAEATNVQQFAAELDTREYPLRTNYRCREAIVEVANRLIAADPHASGRRMRAKHAGGEVRTAEFSTVEREADELATEIEGLIRDGTTPGEIAILVRARFRIRLLLEQLEARGVPVSNWLGASFETEERRALGSALCAVRGRLNDRQAKRFFEFLEVDDLDERDPVAILESVDRPASAPLIELRNIVWSGGDISAVVEQANVAVCAARPHLAAAMANLVEVIRGFAQFDAEFSLEHLLAELALGAVGGAPTATGGVKIATLQSTKGLQWPHVYIVGLEDGRLPSFRVETEEQMREERRICFVGVCRAEHRLTLTRTDWYFTHRQRPSPFLEEMGLA